MDNVKRVPVAVFIVMAAASDDVGNFGQRRRYAHSFPYSCARAISHEKCSRPGRVIPQLRHLLVGDIPNDGCLRPGRWLHAGMRGGECSPLDALGSALRDISSEVSVDKRPPAAIGATSSTRYNPRDWDNQFEYAGDGCVVLSCALPLPGQRR